MYEYDAEWSAAVRAEVRAELREQGIGRYSEHGVSVGGPSLKPEREATDLERLQNRVEKLKIAGPTTERVEGLNTAIAHVESEIRCLLPGHDAALIAELRDKVKNAEQKEYSAVAYADSWCQKHLEALQRAEAAESRAEREKGRAERWKALAERAWNGLAWTQEYHDNYFAALASDDAK